MISAVAGVITASEPSWIAPFAGLSPRAFGKLMRQLRREGGDAPGRGRPWKLSLEDRVLLVAAYWHTNLTLRQLAPLLGVSKSTADRVIDHLGARLALAPRRRFAKDAVLIMDGTLVPTRDHQVAEQSKNYRYSTNHQVVIDADTRLVVVVGRPLPGNRNDCRARVEHARRMRDLRGPRETGLGERRGGPGSLGPPPPPRRAGAPPPPPSGARFLTTLPSGTRWKSKRGPTPEGSVHAK